MVKFWKIPRHSWPSDVRFLGFLTSSKLLLQNIPFTPSPHFQCCSDMWPGPLALNNIENGGRGINGWVVMVIFRQVNQKKFKNLMLFGHGCPEHTFFHHYGIFNPSDLNLYFYFYKIIWHLNIKIPKLNLFRTKIVAISSILSKNVIFGVFERPNRAKNLI